LAQLTIEGLRAGYGAGTALDGFSLDIPSGEIFVLVGGSGSGKSTLLRCVGGFLRPDAGRIVLGGADITALPPHRRNLATLFQSYALFPHMDVAGNIGFGLRRQGLRGAEVDRRVADMLELVRLPGFGARRVATLSGGQQQRVALARCLAPRPSLLLLDEPLSALDPELRAATRADLVALLRQLGLTAILVTHDRAEALATGDRIGVLRDGKLVQTGTPAALFERPCNRFVAGFLGEVNLLPAVVRASGAETLLDVAGGTIRAGASAHAPGTAVTLGLRPERLRRGGGANRLAGIVAGVTYAGATAEMAVRLPGGEILRAIETLDGTPLPQPGTTLTLGWDDAACMVLTA
jgi:putrescine transport system ATP-binding protein